MANRASIDANALLRLILNDQPQQTQQVLKLLESGLVFDIADMVISEVVYVLEGSNYGFTRGETVRSLGRVLADPAFNANASMFRRAFALYIRRPSLSFVDCCAVYYAELNQALPLYTFDRKLANQSNDLARLIV